MTTETELQAWKRRHQVLLVAITKIANCNEQDLVKYCEKVDSLAIDALVKDIHYDDDKSVWAHKLSVIS